VQSDMTTRVKTLSPAAAMAVETRASMTKEDPLSFSKWSRK
jgi:hypothetical protein